MIYLLNKETPDIAKLIERLGRSDIRVAYCHGCKEWLLGGNRLECTSYKTNEEFAKAHMRLFCGHTVEVFEVAGDFRMENLNNNV